MRDTDDRPSAPNYTDACIVMFGVNLMWIMIVIWNIWGFIAAALAGWAVNLVIKRIAVSRG